ncbi:unnamed protein product [Symbiodinium sp. CCMP2592]|nr:unnamed protein product [Symbiodinium sp. CCMP2592]
MALWVFLAFLGIAVGEHCERCADGGDQAAFLQSGKESWPGVRRSYGYSSKTEKMFEDEPFDLPTLSPQDIETITANCITGVGLVASPLRAAAANTTVVMQIVIMPRATPSQPVNLWDVGAKPDDSALLGSRDIARGKAFTALGFSSNENVLSSRQIGGAALVANGNTPALGGIQNTNRQEGAGVVTFGGGIPLFKEGKLVGAVGVSGDGVEQDEAVALACATDFEPPPALSAGMVGENVTNPLSS